MYCCLCCTHATGLFHLVKLPRLNSLSSHLPETLDLAFKLRRRKFSIEVAKINNRRAHAEAISLAT